MNRGKLILAALGLAAFGTAADAADDAAFLDFPMVEAVSAAKVPAFAWLAHQGDKTSVMFARGPDFRRVQIASRSDVNGDPITDVYLSPDGRTVAYMTGAPLGEAAFNPAFLLDPPVPTLWLVATAAGSRPVKVGAGLDPIFTPDGRLMLFKRDGDLWSVDLRAPAAKPKLFAENGADFNQIVWAKNGDMIFVADRRGYSFLGRFKPGGDRVEWLVTGVDRISAPVVSPDGNRVAFLRFPGRRHSKTYDRTEAEPYAIDVLDLGTRVARTVYATRAPAIVLLMDDPESALRWASNDRLVFYSEEDGWGRLYAIDAAGGAPRPLTPTGCMVAESEGWESQLFVIHNCRDRDTRQASIIDSASGGERRLAMPDVVMSRAAGAGGFAAFTGGQVDQAPMLRIVDLKSGETKLAESYADYGYANALASPPPRQVQLTSLDGLPFGAQLFMPATPGPHPALVYVHGGPPRQMFPAFHYSRYYANDYAINRKLAEQGFAVLAVNYRSGIGYGRAFRDAPGRAWRNATEYRDVLAAGRWLAVQPGIDPQRIGIWGGSYGGLLTGQALARNAELFKAGVAIHGVFDWSWPSPIRGHLNPSGFFGVGEKEKEQAFAASPVGHIAGWRSPAMLISGDQDMNVDVLETVDLAQRLREQGVEVRTVIIPGEAHDFVRQSAWKQTWGALSGYVKEKLGR